MLPPYMAWSIDIFVLTIWIWKEKSSNNAITFEHKSYYIVFQVQNYGQIQNIGLSI